MHARMDAYTWRSLQPSLRAHCLHALESMGYSCPTPVQMRTIPHFMNDKDVAVEAETGSGKTLAFVIPIIEAVLARCPAWGAEETAAVIITPTRELATQIAGVFRSFLPAGLGVRLVIGGGSVDQSVATINQKRSVVVVATPGRLLGLLSCSDCRLACHVKALEFLILDEADRLLEMGFQQCLLSILQYLPKQRRTGLFSATLTSDVSQLVKAGLRQPVTITVKKSEHATGTVAMPSRLQCYYVECEAERKMSILVALLNTLLKKKVIVFFATCASVSYFSSLIPRLCPQLEVAALHGRMHCKRQGVFDRFSATSSGVLMCTDVMARGVDFPAVDWVLQFDPPSSSNSFVHRCGRTARMGQAGQALILLTPSEVSYVEFLRLNKGITLQSYPIPPAPSVRELARDLLAMERELYQLSMRAFVSFVRFYFKHECKLIFQARSLDLLAYARGFALLHLPKMPELKTVNTTTFDPHTVSAQDIPFRDKQREREHKRKEKARGSDSYSLRTAVGRGIPVKKQKCKQRCRESDIDYKKRRQRPHQVFSEVDLEELARDARILRKFKRGKISEEELDRQLQM